MSVLEPGILRAVTDRHALLWVCQRYDLELGETPHSLDVPSTAASLRYRKSPSQTDAKIASLYWEAVWLQGARSPLLPAFRGPAEAATSSARPVIVLASSDDVQARVPSEDFLGVRVLPGVIDVSLPLDAQYGSVKARVRERTAWAFAAQLAEYRGRALFVLGARQPEDIQMLSEVIEDTPGLDLTVIVAWPDGSPVPEVPNAPGVSFVWWDSSEEQLIASILESGAPKAGQLPQWAVRVGSRSVILDAKHVRHVLTRFSLLTERDLLTPAMLELDDLHAFFRGDLSNWKAYAAGVPISRAYRTDQGREFTAEIEETLSRVARGDDENVAMTIQLPTEGGAGATTLIRSAGFRAAAAGFPCLVLRPEQVDIDLDHILAFSDSISEQLSVEGNDQQYAILIICDVEHNAIPDLKLITQLLASRNRRVVLLQAIYTAEDAKPKRVKRFVRLPALTSQSTRDEALACKGAFSALSSRWGLPIEPKSDEEWTAYENASRWQVSRDDDCTGSLFWVALHFFLVEGLTGADRESLDDAVSAWIDRRTDRVTDGLMQRMLDFTAVLSSFRIGAPIWTIIRPLTGGIFSSAITDSLNKTQDVIVWGAQVGELDDQIVRFIHPAIANRFLARKGVVEASAKLALIEPVISSLSAGHPADVWLAERIVKEVLVPDFGGRRQFDSEWRIQAFEQIPPLLRDQSKAILHHWARTLYLSADSATIDTPEKLRRIRAAIEKLKAAVKLPRRATRDEHPSHLYNTLGTALARYARYVEASNREDAREAWSDAQRAFQQSINLGSGINVEALLAFSLRLIDHAEQAPESDKTAPASEIAYALDLLDEAEAALSEQATPDPELDEELVGYRSRALNWLEAGAGFDYIRQLQSLGTSDLGFYCEARLHLRNGNPEDLDRAISVLVSAQGRGVTLEPRSLRLYFSLLRRHPHHRFDFAEQRKLLRALEASSPSQMRPMDAFMSAVLCYQLELFVEGAERFRKLREQNARSGNAPPRVREIWRDPHHPDRPRVARLKVTRVLGEWRGEALVYEMGQRVPVRPRHFSPALRLNEVAECVIRFEFFGPLAVPRKFEEVRDRSNQREQ